MTNEKNNNQGEMKSIGYEIFIMLLTILSIFNLILLTFASVDPDLSSIILTINTFITIIFIIDFLSRFFTVKSKTHYFFRGYGWADLLSSLPLIQFKIFRLFRLFRVIQIMRYFGPRKIARNLLYNRAGSALYLTIFVIILVLQVGSLAVVRVEKDVAGANIVNGIDGLWWAFVTITTVGYGDYYPVTNIGRFIGLGVMVVGVATFGVLTGFLANAFVAPKSEEEDVMLDNPNADQAKSDLDEFRRLLDEQERINATLREKLRQLEEAGSG